MKEITPNPGKPPLDEESFQQLLAAAHVLQEHSDKQKAAEAAASKNPPNSKQSHPDSTISPAPAATSAVAKPTAPALAAPLAKEAALTPDYSGTLAEIVATQHQIQMSHLDMENALSLVAERVQKIANADAAVIGLLEQDELVYRAASGTASHLLGEKVHANACLSMGCLLHGATVQCPDVTNDASLGPDFCKEFGIQALIAVPIFSEGNVIGSLEVHYAKADSFEEHDVRTCQLMAGLVTEAKARSAEAEWKQALAAERATMLEALERLKPQLQRLASDSDGETALSEPLERISGQKANEREPAPTGPVTSLTGKDTICNGCGNPLEAAQIYCGICGTERNQPPAGNIQSKWASMWQLSQAQLDKQRTEAVLPQHEVVLPELRRQTPATHTPQDGSSFILPEKSQHDTFAENASPDYGEAATHPSDFSGTQELAAWPGVEHAHDHEGIDSAHPQQTTDETEQHPAQVAAAPGPESPWKPVDEEEQWLKEAEELKSGGALARFLKERRADIYLAAALVIVTAAIFWIVRENSEMVAGAGAPGSNATAAVSAAPRKRQAPPEQKLSLVDQLLVNMGVAEAPTPPAYMGNPDIKVWVDLRTALYYCPNSDVYGKTPKGKFTSQRDAQLDQFEPAYRKVCD